MNTINDKRWQDWCDMFLSAPVAPMTDKLIELFLSMTIYDASTTAEKESMIKARLASEDAPLQYRIFKAHADRIGLKVTSSVWGFVVMMGVNPGNIVMYVHALRRYQQLHGGRLVSMNELARAFPVGFPTDLERLWDAQKLTREERQPGTLMDNYLDSVVDAA